MFEQFVREAQPGIADSLRVSLLSAWFDGALQSADVVSEKAPEAFRVLSGPPADPPGPSGPAPTSGEPEPRPEFPGLERAVEFLADKRIVSPQEFRQLDAAARSQAFTIAGDLSEATIEEVRSKITEAIRQGTPRTEVLESLQHVPLSEARLEMVFRNAANEAYSQGVEHVLDHPLVDDAFPYRIIYPIHDQRARPEHRALEKLGLDGTAVYFYRDPTWLRFRPPWDFNCFPAGTLMQGRFLRGLKSWYDGPIVEITTRKGHRLSVTVNHPILTDRGFVAAGMLRCGQNVLTHGRPVETRYDADRRLNLPVSAARANQSAFTTPCLDKDHAPAPIEQVFRSLRRLGGLLRVGVRPNDLHGDAQFGKGYVDVVAVDGELLLDIHPFSTERSGDLTLSAMDTDLSRVASAGGLGQLSSRLRAGACSLPSAAKLPNESVGVTLDTLPLEALCIGTSANLNASIYETATDETAINTISIGNGLLGVSGSVSGDHLVETFDRSQRRTLTELTDFGRRPEDNACSGEDAFDSSSRDSVFARELLDRFPGAVTLDEIVEVRQFQWSGHVYDLETSGGWQVANGIVASNCRCGWAPMTIRDAARRGVKEAQQWLETGVEPPHPPVPEPPFRPSPAWERRAVLT